MIAVDGDPALRIDFHACPANSPRRCRNPWWRRRRRCRRAIPPCCPRAFSCGALLPDRMLLQLVENFRRADRDDVRIARHGPAAGLERVAPPELDRIERQRRRRFVDQHFQRRHRLQRSVAAHRSRGHAARMQRDRGDIDFRNVVDADRGGRRRRSPRWPKNWRGRRHPAHDRRRMRGSCRSRDRPRSACAS